MTSNQKAAAASADLAYIRQHWRLLAAESWQGYCVHGRGVLLIDLVSGLAPLASYQTQLGGKHQGWLSAELAVQVRSYDPAREIIVLVVRDTCEVLSYRLEAVTLPPPQAYQQLQQRLRVVAA